MRKDIIIVLILVALILMPSFAKAESFDYVEFNEEFGILLNEERVKNGLNELKFSCYLLNLANIRSEEMARYGYISYVDENGVEHPHHRPDGSPWYTVFKEGGGDATKIGAIGENLMIFTTRGAEREKELAKYTFDSWKESKPHYENMLNPFVNYYAVGLAYGNTSFVAPYNRGFAISTNLFIDRDFSVDKPYIPEKPIEPTPVEPETPVVPEVPVEPVDPKEPCKPCNPHLPFDGWEHILFRYDNEGFIPRDVAEKRYSVIDELKANPFTWPMSFEKMQEIREMVEQELIDTGKLY